MVEPTSPSPSASTQPAGEEFEVTRTTFGMVPDWVDEIVTDGTAMRVYVRLARKYANARTRTCYPSQETLADELDISVRSVQRAVAILTECRALIVMSRDRHDGKLGRNRYRLPMDHPVVSAGQHQPPAVSPGLPAKSGGSPAAKSGGSTNQTHTRTRRTDPVADAPELPLDLPRPEQESQDEEKPLTLNQRANKLAGQHYERLGKMGNVPAFLKIIRKALQHGYPDDVVDRACAHIAQHNWTLTEERLRNTLQGGPRRPGSPPAATTPDPSRVVRTGRNGTGPVLQGYEGY